MAEFDELQRLGKVVAQLAKKYPCIDGRNREERGAVIAQKFKNIVNDSRRGRSGGASAVKQEPTPATAATPTRSRACNSSAGGSGIVQQQSSQRRLCVRLSM